VTPAEIAAAEIIRLYRDERLTLRAVAAKAGTSTYSVLKILDEAGIARRPPGRPLAGDQAGIVAAIAGGMARAQVAARFGIGEATVSRIRAGLNPDSELTVSARKATRITGLSAEWLAGAGARGMIRSVRVGHGHRWYYRDEIEALAAGPQR
jgi:hypothetical protein